MTIMQFDFVGCCEIEATEVEFAYIGDDEAKRRGPELLIDGEAWLRLSPEERKEYELLNQPSIIGDADDVDFSMFQLTGQIDDEEDDEDGSAEC